MSLFSTEILEAYQRAVEVREKAYCPYSRFKVGAALKFLGNNKVYLGCNVENASYGATLCAERSALVGAVSAGNQGKLEWVIVVTGEEKGSFPCGMCLQVLNEFSSNETKIYIGNEKSLLEEYSFFELFPKSFGRDSLL